MLMKKLRDTFRGMTSEIQPTAAVTIIPGQRAAANAADFSESEMQARCRRRQARSAQHGLTNVSGWTVRPW